MTATDGGEARLLIAHREKPTTGGNINEVDQDGATVDMKTTRDLVMWLSSICPFNSFLE